ncbi:MAG TPA: response regulator [Chryseosolibacter sp.]
MAKVLLVEDTLELAQQACDILRMEGHNVLISLNGADALQLLRSGNLKPDVIITDLLMPGVDGFTLIEAVKNIPGLADTPIVIMSAKSDQDTVGRASSLGIKKFLAKPCSPEKLLQSIEAVIGD